MALHKEEKLGGEKCDEFADELLVVGFLFAVLEA